MSLPAVRPGMNERITSVTAYTTLDLVDGAALGHDWTENGSGVLNVTASDETRSGRTAVRARRPRRRAPPQPRRPGRPHARAGPDGRARADAVRGPDRSGRGRKRRLRLTARTRNERAAPPRDRLSPLEATDAHERSRRRRIPRVPPRPAPQPGARLARVLHYRSDRRRASRARPHGPLRRP